MCILPEKSTYSIVQLLNQVVQQLHNGVCTEAFTEAILNGKLHFLCSAGFFIFFFGFRTL